jgi:dTDP-glucose 4,6-dehydratase
VLVTGGAGFIGSNFVRFLLATDTDVQVVNLDALTYAGSLENLKELPSPERHAFVHGDIRDPSLVHRLLEQHGIDTIIHFAAETHVDRSIRGPAPFIQTNIEGTFVLLEAAHRVWIEEKLHPPHSVRFHHVSTDEVYGDLPPTEPAFSEASPYRPNSPYAASKAASDHLVRAYAHTYELPITISNCSNNYGPYQFPEKLIPLAILCAHDGRPVPVYGDGRQVRDWLYVEDHCRAVYSILRHGQIGSTYNIGGENQPTNLEVIERICSILDARFPGSPHLPHKALIAHVPDRPGHDRRYAMDTAEIKRELRWAPQETLDSGLAKTVDWYLEHLDWAEAIGQRPSFREWLDQNYARRAETQ